MCAVMRDLVDVLKQNVDFGPISVDEEIFIVCTALKMGQCHIMLGPKASLCLLDPVPSVTRHLIATYAKASGSLYFLDQMLLLKWSCTALEE